MSHCIVVFAYKKAAKCGVFVKFKQAPCALNLVLLTRGIKSDKIDSSISFLLSLSDKKWSHAIFVNTFTI